MAVYICFVLCSNFAGSLRYKSVNRVDLPSAKTVATVRVRVLRLWLLCIETKDMGFILGFECMPWHYDLASLQ